MRATALLPRAAAEGTQHGIEQRFRAKFCAENDGKYWLTQVFDEWQEDGKTPADFLGTLARQAASQPYAECNFLKKSFLDACKQVGLFDSLADKGAAT